MTGFKFDARMRLSIELALTANRSDPLLLRLQDDDARALGMNGAEIDMARAGTSFDFQTSVAIAFALVLDDANRQRALRAGLCKRTCAEIENVVATINRSR